MDMMLASPLSFPKYCKRCIICSTAGEKWEGEKWALLTTKWKRESKSQLLLRERRGEEAQYIENMPLPLPPLSLTLLHLQQPLP